jgi:hypothetical protein
MSESPKVSSRDDIAVVEPVKGPDFAPYESPAGGWGALLTDDQRKRVLRGFKARPYNIPDGASVAYYRETSVDLS